MNISIIKHDFRHNKLIHLILILFIVFSTAIASLAVASGARTLDSISQLFKIAEPPHFLQMHRGEIDLAQVEAFMDGRVDVTYWQVQDTIQVDGYTMEIIRGEKRFDLSDFKIDIGLVHQNSEKDLLLSSDLQVARLEKGEIGIPALMSRMYDIKVGDRVVFRASGVEREFVVAAVVLDSMMNSTMCSSTRVLLSDEDFDAINGLVGENEYLIEAYLTYPKAASSFQTDYQNAGLPQNGQAIQYAFLYALSALTDILTVFVLLFAGLFILLIAFACVRFVLMATMEEEVRTIGSLKAIGIDHRDIRNIYLMKYRLCAAFGVIPGFLLSVLAQPLLTENIRAQFGSTGNAPLAYLLSALVAVVVYLAVVMYCRSVLRRIKKQSVVDTLLRGKTFEATSGAIRFPIRRFGWLSIDARMALRQVVFRFRNWAVVFFTVTAVVVFTLIPMHLLQTFRSPDFITYMGHAREDVMISMLGGEAQINALEKTISTLENDPDVRSFHLSKKIRMQSGRPDGTLMNIEIDFGPQAGQGLEYLDGQAPQIQDEIALSFLNAEELGKTPGDTIILLSNGQSKTFTVSGIYQDVTAAGRTAKSPADFPADEIIKYTFSILLMDSTTAAQKAAEWSEILPPEARVDPMDELIDQTLGGVSRQLEKAVRMITVIGPALCLLIGLLYLRLRIVKDRREIAGLRTIGFTSYDLRRQYRIKIVSVTLAGILAGIAVTYLGGHFPINAFLAMSGLGIRSVVPTPAPLFDLLLFPAVIMTLLVLSSEILTAKMIDRYRPTQMNA
jgi:putative ABC transport system permease protein